MYVHTCTYVHVSVNVQFTKHQSTFLSCNYCPNHNPNYHKVKLVAVDSNIFYRISVADHYLASDGEEIFLKRIGDAKQMIKDEQIQFKIY